MYAATINANCVPILRLSRFAISRTALYVAIGILTLTACSVAMIGLSTSTWSCQLLSYTLVLTSGFESL